MPFGVDYLKVVRLVVAVLLVLLCNAAICHATTWLAVNDDSSKPLKLVLKRPAYRHTIFASMPVKTLLAEAYPSVYINPGLIVDSRLEMTVIDAKGKVFASTSVVNRGLTFLIRIELDVTDLRPGVYNLVARLHDSAGNTVKSVLGLECVDQHPLTKLPPAPHEVVFDGHGICHVDGRPFFPIGIFHIWPGILGHMNDVRRGKNLEPLTWEGWFQKLKEAGFNSFQDWQGGREPEELRARYDIAERLGFKGQVHSVSRNDRDVRTLADHGGVLGWHTFDEPMLHGQTTEKLSRKYEHLKELDPYRPQFICDNQPSSLDAIAPNVDVIMHDLYPQGDGDMRIVGRATRHARSLKTGQAPVWPVIQSFQISRYSRKADGSAYSFSRLSEVEMRSVVFDVLACGATGIYYYAYYTPEGPQDLPDGSTRNSYVVDDFPDQWKAMKRINHELRLIIPAILFGRTIATSVRPVDSDVNAATFVDGHHAIVVVANPTRDRKKVRLGVPGVGGRGRSLYGPETIIARRGLIELSLETLAAQAFSFALP